MVMSDVSYVEIHGNRLAYRDTGAGDEVVVLLHGMAGSSDTWAGIIPELAKSHRVIAPDLLGHGRSAKPRGDYSLGAFAVGLRDLLDELGIDRATVVGHSLGGGVAMQFLFQHPEYCRRLILVSSGGLGPDVGWILRLLSAPGAEFVLPVIAPKIVLNVGDRLRSWLGTVGWESLRMDQMWQAYSSLSDPPTRSAFLHTLRSVVDYRGQAVSALSRLRLRSEVPTLVIWGDHDAIIPVEHAYQVHSARPGSRLHVLAGLGHFPHVESPTDVAASITQFIADTRDAGEVGQGNARELLNAVLGEHAALEVAVGMLRGLRGCSHDEAVREFTRAAQETDVAAIDLGHALVDLASGQEPPAHRTQVMDRWGHLLAARGLGVCHNGVGGIPNSVRVQYGPHNPSTIC